jgi:hypothetical protein
MKILFNQPLPQVSARINSPAKEAESHSGEFKALLRDISPFHSESLKKQGEMGSSPSLSEPPAEPMASLKPSHLPLSPPPTSRLNVESLEIEEMGVNTPTLVKAERRRIPSGYQENNLSPRASEVMKLTSAYGNKYGVDPHLATAVAEVESSFNPRAISQDGHASKGLFQLLDSTGKELLERTALAESYRPFDPDQNTELGVSYLRYLHDLFTESNPVTKTRYTKPAGDVTSLEKLAVAAFNAGEGRVAGAQARAQANGRDPGNYDQVAPYLPEITQNYVEKVTNARARYSGRDDSLEGS